MKEKWRRSHQRRSEGTPFVESSSTLQASRFHDLRSQRSIRLLVGVTRGTLELRLEKDSHNFQQTDYKFKFIKNSEALPRRQRPQHPNIPSLISR